MSDGYSAAEVRELVENNDLGLPALTEAGLVESSTHDLLLRIKRHSPQGTDDERYQRILEREVSRNVREGVVSGHASTLNHLTGLSQSRNGLDGYRTIEELESLWEDYPAFSAYVFAPTPPEGPVGVGKSDFAYLLCEVAQRVYPDINIASNASKDEFRTFEQWSSVEEWLKTTDGRKLFVLDEAAQVLQFSDMSEGKVLSKLLKLIRKYQGNIILIGHTGRDVPRDVRRQMLIVKKESKKKATIGTGLSEENEEIRVADDYMRLTGIPPTTLDWDTMDTADFDFDVEDSDTIDDDEDEEELVVCKQEECSATSEQYQQVAETGYCPYHEPEKEQEEQDE